MVRCPSAAELLAIGWATGTSPKFSLHDGGNGGIDTG